MDGHRMEPPRLAGPAPVEAPEHLPSPRPHATEGNGLHNWQVRLGDGRVGRPGRNPTLATGYFVDPAAACRVAALAMRRAAARQGEFEEFAVALREALADLPEQKLTYRGSADVTPSAARPGASGATVAAG